MKANEILKRLSWTMTLPYGINVRSSNNLLDEMASNESFKYDGPSRFIPDEWYLEIFARYENLEMMENFSSPDVICKSREGGLLYFLIEN